MNEQHLRMVFQNSVEDGHISSIESGHGSTPGIPDFTYTVGGMTGFIELKVCSDVKRCEFRRSQIMWFKFNVHHGGHPLVLVGSPDMVGIFNGDAVPAIHHRYAEEVFKHARHTWQWPTKFNILHNITDILASPNGV